MKVELMPTRTSGSSPAGGVQPPAQAGSSSRGPVTRTFGGGEKLSYSNARLVSRSPVGALEVLEHRAGRLEPVGAPGLVQLVDALVEQACHQTVDRPVACPAERPAGGFETRAQRRRPRARNESRFDTRNANGRPSASAAISAPKTKKFPHHHVGGATLELGAHVRGERASRPDHRPVPGARERLERRGGVPVLHDHALRIEVRPLGGAVPGHVLGPGGLDVGSQHAVGQHAHVVAALDHRADDRRVGRHRAAAVDDREQVSASGWSSSLPFE